MRVNVGAIVLGSMLAIGGCTQREVNQNAREAGQETREAAGEVKEGADSLARKAGA